MSQEPLGPYGDSTLPESPLNDVNVVSVTDVEPSIWLVSEAAARARAQTCDGDLGAAGFGARKNALRPGAQNWVDGVKISVAGFAASANSRVRAAFVTASESITEKTRNASEGFIHQTTRVGHKVSQHSRKITTWLDDKAPNTKNKLHNPAPFVLGGAIILLIVALVVSIMVITRPLTPVVVKDPHATKAALSLLHCGCASNSGYASSEYDAHSYSVLLGMPS